MCSGSLQERDVTDVGALRARRVHIVQSAAALAAGMGVGRFVYTPILPLMNAQVGLSAGTGASLATANYAGYLAGALGGILLPRLVRSSTVLRCSLLVLSATLAAMPLTHATALWLGLRLSAGVTSALIFVIAVSSLLGHLRGHPVHLPGWAFGGIGAGIALSGLLMLILRSVADWRVAWWAAAGLAILLAVPSWNLRPESAPQPVSSVSAGQEQAKGRRVHRWFIVLFVSYTLEGVGYIIAGTFLVAAIEQRAPAWIGSAAWILVGLAAIPLRSGHGCLGAGPALVSCSPHSSSKRSASPHPPWSAASQRRSCRRSCSVPHLSGSAPSRSPQAPTCGSRALSRC